MLLLYFYHNALDTPKYPAKTLTKPTNKADPY
jgi:hypothetical protein